jgi:hypothetical protein
MAYSEEDFLMVIKPLQFGDWPMRYQLELKPLNDGLLILAHSSVLDRLEMAGPSLRQVKVGLGSEGFSRFDVDRQGCFGFDRSAQTSLLENGWVKLDLPFPRNEKSDETAFWKGLSAIVRSLEVFFLVAETLESHTKVSNCQLFSVGSLSASGDGFGRRGLWGAVSPQMASRLAMIKSWHWEEVEKAMFRVSSWLLPHCFTEERCFFCVSIDVTNGFGSARLCVPGDDCKLEPSSSSRSEQGGYQFVPHNVGDPIQQLSLLAGLTKLGEFCRRDI